jgi:hypothetical protein
MTSTPDLNIDGSPIYESLVATTGDPYQPPAYQLPDVYGAGRAQMGGAEVAGYGGAPGWDAGAAMGMGMPMAGMGTPAMLSQFLGRMLGDNQSWCAIMIFGGPVADQLRQLQQMQFMQSQAGQQPYMQPPFMQSPFMQAPFMPAPPAPAPPTPQYAAPGMPASGSLPGYDAQGAMAQAYQQAYQWAATQQAMLAASQELPLALTSGPETADIPQYLPPPELPPAEETQAYGGMLNQDWSGWLGQTSQERSPEPQEVEPDDPYDRRGGRLTGRFGAAMRELRGR